jgi:hypothetical protein
MIHKDATFGKTKNVTLLEFGTGDILMTGSRKSDEGITVVAMKTMNKPMPINVRFDSRYKTFNEMQPEVVLVFKEIESIDSLISALQNTKIEMQSNIEVTLPKKKGCDRWFNFEKEKDFCDNCGQSYDEH